MRLALSTLLLATVACSTPAADQSSPLADDCFDAAVVASVVRYEESPIPDLGADVIVIRYPHILTIDAKQSVIGPPLSGEMRVTMVMHSPLTTEVDYFLMYLKQEKDGYHVVSLDLPIVKDSSGRFILKPYGGTLPDIEVTRRVNETAQVAGAFCEATG